MHRPRPLKPDRIRIIERPFGWIPFRILSSGIFSRLSVPARQLYFFLCLVADKNGISFYGDFRLNMLLKLTSPELSLARSDALAAPVEEAHAYMQQQDVVNADETGHKVAGKKAWMWLAASSLVAVFMIRLSRGTKVAKEFLGAAFVGILTSDRWNAYNCVDAVRRQLCWAHLIRDFTKISQRSGLAGHIGIQLV